MDQVDTHYVPSWGVSDPTGEELIAYVKEAEKMGTIAVFIIALFSLALWMLNRGIGLRT